MKQEIIDKQIELSGHMKEEKTKAIHETEQELRSAIIEIAGRLERIAHLYATQIGMRALSSYTSIDVPFCEYNGVAIEFSESNGTVVKVELRNKAGITYVIRDEEPYMDFYQAEDYVRDVFYQYSIAVIVLKWLKIHEYDICNAIADYCVSNKAVTSGYEESYYIDNLKGE